MAKTEHFTHLYIYLADKQDNENYGRMSWTHSASSIIYL